MPLDIPSSAEHGRRLRASLAARIDSLIVHERVRNYPIIFVVLGTSILLVTSVVNPTALLTDYLAHWTGGRMLLTGQSAVLYDVTAQYHVQTVELSGTDDISWFVSPPFVAYLYAVFATLPYLLSGIVWTVVSVGLLAASAHLGRPLAPPWLQRRWGLVVLVVAASAPVFRLVGSGQDSALVLFLWIAGTRLLMANREATAGAVFALGLIKPQMMFMVPLVFLFERRFRALSAWVATACGLVALSVLAVGVDGLRTWIALPFTAPYQQGVQVGQAWLMQSIPAFFTSVAPPTLSVLAQMAGLAVSGLVVTLFVLHVIRGRARGLPTVELWAFAAVTTMLCSPHLLDYDLVMLFPVALYLLGDRTNRSTRLSLVLLFVLTWTVPSRHALFGTLPWPLSLPSAAWSAVPLVILWHQFHRAGLARRTSFLVTIRNHGRQRSVGQTPACCRLPA